MKNGTQIVDGKFYKKCKVVMLPTEKANYPFIGIYHDNGKQLLTWVTGNHNNSALIQPQHLYFLSDEEIKEGDWFINHENTISRAAPRHVELFPKIKHQCKKIIATTDSLGLAPFGGQDILELSRPSNEFLKKYCKLGGINEVLVEYEYNHDDTVPFPKTVEGREFKLKVAPDNTITIKPIKEEKLYTMYNKKEVINLLKSLSEYYLGDKNTTDNWIKENL